MVKKVNLAIIHGMGDQERGYSDTFQEMVTNNLRSRGFEDVVVNFEEIFWADVLREQEIKVYERANYKGDLEWTDLRRFFVNALGDAIAYQPMVSDANRSL
jgi:hypothetical protein